MTGPDDLDPDLAYLGDVATAAMLDGLAAEVANQAAAAAASGVPEFVAVRLADLLRVLGRLSEDDAQDLGDDYGDPIHGTVDPDTRLVTRLRGSGPAA
jgi:hypothetical protein